MPEAPPFQDKVSAATVVLQMAIMDQYWLQYLRNNSSMLINSTLLVQYYLLTYIRLLGTIAVRVRLQIFSNSCRKARVAIGRIVGLTAAASALKEDP